MTTSPRSRIGYLLPRNRFARSVSVLVGGTAGGQIAAVLAAPLLVRWYSPDDFGLLAVFTALLSFVAVAAGLRYETAIPLPPDDRDAAALTALALSCVVIVSAACAIPAVLYSKEIAVWLNTPRLAEYLFLVPFGALFAGIYGVLNFCAIRAGEFGPLAKTRFSQSFFAAFIQLVGAPLGALGLLLGQMAGQGAGALSLGLRVVAPRRALFADVNHARLIDVAVRYRDCPKFSTVGALFNTAGAQLSPVLFAALFSPVAAGMYMLANRVLIMPMQTLGMAVGHVFVSDAAVAHREDELAPLTANVHRRLAQIGMPPMLVLLIAGPELFSLVFGAQWRDAGVYARWLAPSLYLAFVTSPLGSLYSVLEQQAVSMTFQGLSLGVRVAAIVAGASLGDIMIAIALFAAGSALCCVGNLAWILRASGNTWRAAWQPSLQALGWSLPQVSPLMIGAVWPMRETQWLLLLIVAFVLIAARYVVLMRRAWR